MLKERLPRGIRNNNPLNIRRGKTKWVGETIMGDIPDRIFCQFEAMKYGWRAAFLLIKKYINVYKCNTIEKIINKWAPPNENKTNHYIIFVAMQCGIEAGRPFDFNDPVILRIGAAMCMMENGEKYNPYGEKNKKLLEAMQWGKAYASASAQFKNYKSTEQTNELWQP